MSLERLVARYLEWLVDHAYSEATVYDRKGRLRALVAWCAERGIDDVGDLSVTVIERYQRHLAHWLKEDGTPLGIQTQHTYLVTIRAFCRWLAKCRLSLVDAASTMDLPRVSDRVPRRIFTPEEAEKIINVPDTSKPLGIRDRAILETLYSTGIRRGEIVKLAIGDLDFSRGTALIREGKYRKDRMVPIGERALAWVERYLNDVRPEYLVPPDEGVVFLTRFGRPYVPAGITEMVTNAVKAAEISKGGSAHAFRHGMATAMLEGGADIRFIQQMLGHESLNSTQIYTRVSIRALKEVHDATHPGAKLKRRQSANEDNGDET